MGNLIDLTGKSFGRLTVIERAETHVQPNGKTVVMWKCKCECGKAVTVDSSCLRRGNAQSCGCLAVDTGRAHIAIAHQKNKTHCGSYERLYSVWHSMRERCNNPSHRRYADYGGRGISICKEWDDYATFREWALQNGYDANARRGVHTIDRIDVDGNYEPSNCRWCDMKTQANNRRNNRL